MMTSLIGDKRLSPKALEAMKASPYNYEDTRWAAYQNHELGPAPSPGGPPTAGHLVFMATGPKNTFKEATERLPDSSKQIGWRYVHVGFVNFETGEIDEG